MPLRRSARLSAITSNDTFADITFCGVLFGAKDSKVHSMYASKIYHNLKRTLPKRYPKANYCVLVDHTTSASFINMASRLQHVRLVYLKHDRPDNITTFRLLLISEIPQQRKYCCLLDLHDEFDSDKTIKHFGLINRFVTRNQGQNLAIGFWPRKDGSYCADGGYVFFRIKGKHPFKPQLITQTIKQYTETEPLCYNGKLGSSEESIINNIWCQVDEKYKIATISDESSDMSLSNILILDPTPSGRNENSLECIDITTYNVANKAATSTKHADLNRFKTCFN